MKRYIIDTAGKIIFGSGLLFLVLFSVCLRPAAAEELDFDGDGYSDEVELASGYSPYNPEPVKITVSDMDSDGLSDYWERQFGTDPFRSDTDGDGFRDLDEIDRAYDPLSKEEKRLSQSIEIDLKKQLMTYLVGGRPWKEWAVSTGKTSMPTPRGEFKIVNKSLKPWSRAYGLWMPYWLGLGGDGLRNGSIGIHELPVWPGGYREGEDHLGQPVSHGCIRLGVGAARYLYELVEVGTAVVIK